LRNAIVHGAWSRGYELLVFVDDDEHPTAPLHDGRTVSRAWDNFLGPHGGNGPRRCGRNGRPLQRLREPDSGGLWSPVSAGALLELGLVVALGNELIGEASFTATTRQFLHRHRPTPCVSPEADADPARLQDVHFSAAISGSTCAAAPRAVSRLSSFRSKLDATIRCFACWPETRSSAGWNPGSSTIHSAPIRWSDRKLRCPSWRTSPRRRRRSSPFAGLCSAGSATPPSSPTCAAMGVGLAPSKRCWRRRIVEF
jgi:hypothetical protein